MDPLSRDENYPRQLTPEMWREIKSAPPEVIAEMQDDLKHGNTYYTGVETGKGVLLFGRDYVGNRQYGDFMATNIENREKQRRRYRAYGACNRSREPPVGRRNRIGRPDDLSRRHPVALHQFNSGFRGQFGHHLSVAS